MDPYDHNPTGQPSLELAVSRSHGRSFEDHRQIEIPEDGRDRYQFKAGGFGRGKAFVARWRWNAQCGMKMNATFYITRQ